MWIFVRIEGTNKDAERMLSVVATCRQHGRNFLEVLTACCVARLGGSDAPSLLPAKAELAAARQANLTLALSGNRRDPLTRESFSG